MAVKNFDNFGDLAMHLMSASRAITPALHTAVRDAVKIVADSAKESIGKYQGEVQGGEGIGVFPAWSPLADSTEREKQRLGYPLDAPLLRDGKFRDDIKGEAVALKGIVGSNDPVAYYHEVGTPRMPPRPVFGPAGARNEKEIRRMMLDAVVGALIFGHEIAIPIGRKRIV